MKPIQFVLLPIFLLLIWYFGRRLKDQPLLRFFVWLGLIAAGTFTLFLDSSTQIANWLGIDRGVDMVSYFSLLGLSIACILLYLRSLRLERMLTEVIRAQALSEKKQQSA